MVHYHLKHLRKYQIKFQMKDQMKYNSQTHFDSNFTMRIKASVSVRTLSFPCIKHRAPPCQRYSKSIKRHFSLAFH